jgi:hypothetical protein
MVVGLQIDNYGVHEDSRVRIIVKLSLTRVWVLYHWLITDPCLLLCSHKSFWGKGVVYGFWWQQLRKILLIWWGSLRGRCPLIGHRFLHHIEIHDSRKMVSIMVVLTT